MPRIWLKLTWRFPNQKWNGPPKGGSIGPEAFVLCGERSLFEMRHFEERCKGCLHSPLSLNAELFEALLTERAVFELATVSSFSEPFSTVPALHYCCNTHFSSFTSLSTDTISIAARQGRRQPRRLS